MTAPAGRLDPEFVDSFPDDMRSGVLYISLRFNTCGHLCACGCGEEVVTPLSPAQWNFTYDGVDVSLSPSVGNWALPCQSHYWIHRGKVRWSSASTPDQIARARAADQRDLRRHTAQSRPKNSVVARLRGLMTRDRG